MEFAFTEEQLMIRETAASFLADVSASAAIREAMATEQGYSAELWQRICTELYFQAITIPEEHGGMGLGYVELVAVMEQMGRYLLCSPFFSTVCLGVNALRLMASAEQQAEYFAQILEGKTFALAFNNDGRVDACSSVATYSVDGDTYVLNGDYRYVIDGHSADFLLLVTNNSAGEPALFVTQAEAAGVNREWLPTMDQTRKQAAITVQNLKLEKNQCLSESAAAALAQVQQLAAIALAAEQVGGTQQVLDMTAAYTKERVQFNRPVGSFQAVKHQLADMMLRAEVAHSSVYYAACVADDFLQVGALAGELSEAASVTKAYCSDAYFKNAGDAIQLHGGVGFTWEYDVHLYFKRAKSSELLLGNGAFHREQVAKLLLDTATETATTETKPVVGA